MKNEERALSELQREILLEIKNSGTTSINYGHPERQLRELFREYKEITYDEVIDALRSLDSDFHVLHFVPKTFLGWNTSLFEVDEKINQINVYDS